MEAKRSKVTVISSAKLEEQLITREQRLYNNLNRTI